MDPTVEQALRRLRPAKLMKVVLAQRERLNRLAAGGTGGPTLGDRLAGLGGAKPAPETARLLELDRLVERAGLHTLADARLFGRLLRDDPRLGLAGERLASGADDAAAELHALLDHHERLVRTGEPAPGALAGLEDLWARLLRLVKVAEILVEPDGCPPALLWGPLPKPPRRAPPDARVALAERFLARAHEGDLVRRQRDLRTAHELLLRAAPRGDRDRAHALRLEVAAVRRDLAELQKRDPFQELSRAVQDGEGAALWSAAARLYRDGLGAGDARLAGSARRLLGALEGRLQGSMAQAIDRERVEALRDGALGPLEQPPRDRLAEIALGTDPTKWSAIDIAADAGAFFDVEEFVGYEEEPPPPSPMLRVPYPSQHMEVDQAESIEQLRDFIVPDPRLVLYDLASGRQLARTHYQPQPPEPPKRRGSVRVYVLDASASMEGPRARFRDAILMSELGNVTACAGQGRPFSPLYFAFFNDRPTRLERVDGPARAVKIAQRLCGAAAGETDITLALKSAFEAIRDARGQDPELSRATVVVVTDGQDYVDARAVEEARAPVGEVEITLSFIALGRENRYLRELVDRQREAGRRAFYCSLTDDEVAGARGLFDAPFRTLLPLRAEVDLDPKDPELQAALAALLAAGAPPEEQPEGPSAAVRFEALFPESPPTAAAAACEPERVAGLLAAVAEAAALAPGERRAAEAVELLEHLLRVYAIGLPSYLAALARLPEPGGRALAAIRLLSAP